MSDNPTTGDGSNPNAISLFGQSANMNDFPVLKAFQEYIDAEQAKARKRMLGLSIFFIVLLVAVVVTFTIIVISIFTHNRQLSDRLLDVALRERQIAVAPQQQPAPQPIVVPQPVVAPAPAQDTGMKALLEKLESLAAAMATRQQQAVAPTPVVVTTAAPTPIPQMPAAESAETQQMREKIKKQQAELEAERARVKAAEEKLRQAEIERHRRRLYPEYYAQRDAVPVQQKPQPRESVPAAKAPMPEPKRETAAPTSLKSLKPIDYFAQSAPKTAAPPPSNQTAQAPAAKKEPPARPVASKQASAANAPAPKQEQAKQKQPPKQGPAKEQPKKQTAPAPAIKTETINVGTTADDSIPWLIEQNNL